LAPAASAAPRKHTLAIARPAERRRFAFKLAARLLRKSDEEIENDVLEAMRKAGTPPQILYAYRKTGLIGVKGKMENWPADSREEWDNAIKEYFLIEDASKRPDGPDPSEWKTEIPELLLSPFTKQDLAQVHECLAAIAPIEERGMLMAAACEHGYASGEEDGERHGPGMFSLTEQLVVRRARDIYAQGSMGSDSD
jgi:hypothetical protein